MDVVSTPPLRVASLIWQPWAGAWALTVVCKATFSLEPGECRLTEAPEEPAAEEGSWDEDRVPFKPRADVLLVGSAFAPRGEAVRSLTARLRVGGIDKAIEVWCDRIFWHDGRVLLGPAFARMPLGYERAAGGPLTANPVGVRFDAPPDAHGAVRIPNLQPPGTQVARQGDTFAPVAFAPVAPGWPERLAKLKQHAAGWSHQRWAEQPLPRDIDAGYFNAAPRDQQVSSLRTDEAILLKNLHPQHPGLETRLPGIAPRAAVTREGQPKEDVPLTCDTLWIDTDRALVTVVWRGRVGLSHPGEPGRVEVSLPGHAESEEEEVGTMPLGVRLQDTMSLEMLAKLRKGSMTVPMAGKPESAPTLPFVAPESPWAKRRTGPVEAPPIAMPVPEDTGTLMGARAPAGNVLPFVQQTPPEAAQPVQIGYLGGEVKTGGAEPAPWAPLDIPAPVAEVEPAPLVEEVPEPVQEAESGLPLAAFGVERCAAIAASLARRRPDRQAILDENGVVAADFQALERHWEDAIRAELSRGKRALLDAYDDGFVSRLEEERGPILPAEYARLAVAAERGGTAAVLVDLTLPRESAVRIERVWLRRIRKDRSLAREVRSAIATTRKA